MAKYNFIAVTAFFIAVAIVIAGCKGGSTKGADIPDVFIGTEGLDVRIDAQSVPSIVTAGSSADIVLLISNKGALPILASSSSPALIIFHGMGDFTLEKVDLPTSGGKYTHTQGVPLINVVGPLEGRESTGAVGYFDGLRLTIKAKEFAENEEPVDTSLLATACYQYGTKLAANVCIDTSTYSFRKERKPCDPKVPVVLKSQGAPVAVTKIETITERDEGGVIKPKFKIYISNVGKGVIVEKNSLDVYCKKPKEGESKKAKITNIVFADSITLNDKELGSGIECAFQEEYGERAVVLSGNPAKDYLLCSYTAQDFTEAANLGTFVSPLKVQLSYGYSLTSDAVPIRVEKGLGCKPDKTVSCTGKDNVKGKRTCGKNGVWGGCVTA